MALTSFTLRKTSGGSYTQKSGETDRSIRADGVSEQSIVESITTGDNTFSANLIGSGVVRLEWTLEDTLTDEVSITSGVAPTELRIISSYSGEPVTVRDGILIQTITSQSLASFYDDVPVVNAGRWVYYSLFAKYSDGNDFWFVRVASLYIQIPIPYQSVESLWRKIPEYYRTLDYLQPDLSSGLTPLYAFLELFGNEIDRTRTLIDSVALSNDPELSVTPALAELAREVGLEFTIEDLGTTKVRALMSNIGTLRQQKGTIGSICSYISAMSGCRVEYEYNPALPKPHVFNVYAQRVNFVADPEFADSTISASSGTVTQNGNTLYRTVQNTTTWGVLTYGTNSIGASNPSIVNANNGITITLPAGSYANRTVMVYSNVGFPYLGTQTYGTGFDYVPSAGASFSAMHVNSSTLQTILQTSTSWPSALFYDTWNNGLVYSYNSTSARPTLEYYPSTVSASSTTVSCVPVLVFTMAPGSSITVKNWLLEPATGGDFFSGNTREGGYIPIQTGTSGGGTFDYYWDTEFGGANNSYSYYLLDHERTIKTTERVVAQYIVPVTMVDGYSIVWDYYPGK